MDWIFQSLYHAVAMLWEMLWALVLGFAISACLQVYISKEQMAKWLGKSGLKEVLLAAGLGAASSSCSYAAAAATRTMFKKGAGFVPALSFMIASTNLVVELGIVLCLIMGWRFVLAEVVGAFVMITVMWLIVALTRPRKLIEAARQHEEREVEGHCHQHEGGEASRLRQVADAFYMDWSMLWKEIVIGVLIAGFLMVLVPAGWWQLVFISQGAYAWRLVENALVGPLIAVASFVCSVGNIPLASVLWASGSTFGGVVAFIYGDLIVLPLIVGYAKYYGKKAAIYITVVLFTAMVVAGILVDLLFAGLGLIPQGERAASAAAHAGFSWNYTTWLDFAALLAGGFLLYLHFRKPAHSPHSHC